MNQRLRAVGFVPVVLALVTTMLAVSSGRAEMELAPPPQADFERSAPEVLAPPPADDEPSQPEIEPPSAADWEPAAPDIDDGADIDQGDDTE